MAMVAQQQQQQQQQTPSREGGSRKRLQRHRAGPSKDGSTRSLSVFTNQETGGMLPRNTELTMSMYEDDRLSTSGSVSGTSELMVHEGDVNDGERVPQWAANSFFFQPSHVPIYEEAHPSAGDGTFQSSYNHAFQSSVASGSQGSPSTMRVVTRNDATSYNEPDSPLQKKRATGDPDGAHGSRTYPGNLQQDAAPTAIRSSLSDQAELSSTDPKWRDEKGILINVPQGRDNKHRNRAAAAASNEDETETDIMARENLENARKEASRPALQLPESSKPKPNSSAGSSPRSVGRRRIHDVNQLDGEGDTGDKQDGSLPRSSASGKSRGYRRTDDDGGDAEVPIAGISDRGAANSQYHNYPQPNRSPSGDNNNLIREERESYRKTMKIEEPNRKRDKFNPVTINVSLASGGPEDNIYESIEYAAQHKALPAVSLAHAKDSVGRDSKKKDSFRRHRESDERAVPIEADIDPPTAAKPNVPPALVLERNNRIEPAAGNNSRQDEYPAGDVYEDLAAQERDAGTRHSGQGPSSGSSHANPMATAGGGRRGPDGGLGGSRESLDIEIDGNRLAAPRYVSAMDRHSPVIDIAERSPKPHHRSSVKLTPAELSTARQQREPVAHNGRRLSGDQKHDSTKDKHNGSQALIGQSAPRRTSASNSETAIKAVNKNDIQPRNTDDIVPSARTQSSSSKQQVRPPVVLDDPYLSSASDVAYLPLNEQDGYQYENPVRLNNQRPTYAGNNSQRPSANNQRPIAVINNHRSLYNDPSSSVSSSSLTSSVNADENPYLQPTFQSYVDKRSRENSNNNDEVYYSNNVRPQERQIAQAGNRSLPYNGDGRQQQFTDRGMGTHGAGYSQRDASNSPVPGMRNGSARDFGTQPLYDRRNLQQEAAPLYNARQQQQPLNNSRYKKPYDQDDYSSTDYEEPLPHGRDDGGRAHNHFSNYDDDDEAPYYNLEDQGRYNVNEGRVFRPVGPSPGTSNDTERYYAHQEPRQLNSRPYSDVQSDSEQRPRHNQRGRDHPSDRYANGHAPNNYKDRLSFNEAPSRSRTLPPEPGRLYADAEYQPYNGKYGNRGAEQPQNDYRNVGLPLSSYRPGFGSMPNQLNNAHLNATLPLKDQSVFGSVEIVPQSVDPELQSAAKKDNTYHISVKLHSHGVPQLAPKQRDDSTTSMPMLNNQPDYEVPIQQGTLDSAYPGYGPDGKPGPSTHHNSRPDIANAPRNQFGSRPDLNKQPNMVTTGGYGPNGPNNSRGSRPDLSDSRPGQGPDGRGGPANQFGSRPDLNNAPGYPGYEPNSSVGPANQYGSRPDLNYAPRSGGYDPDGTMGPGNQYGSRPDLSNGPRQGPGGYGPGNQYGKPSDVNNGALPNQSYPNRRARSPHPGGIRNSSLAPFPNNVDPYYMQPGSLPDRAVSPHSYNSAGNPYLSLPSDRQGRPRKAGGNDLPYSDGPDGSASPGRYPDGRGGPSRGNHVMSIALRDDNDDMADSNKPPHRRPRSHSHRDIASSDGEYIVKSFKPSNRSAGGNKPNNNVHNKAPLADAANAPAASKEPLYTMSIDNTLTVDYVNPRPPAPILQPEPAAALRNGQGLYALPRSNDGYKSSDNDGIIGIDRKGKLLINNGFDSIGRPKFVPLVSDQGSDEDEEPNLRVPHTDENVFDSGYYQPRENPLYASDSDGGAEEGELPEVDVEMKLAEQKDQQQQQHPLQWPAPVKAEMKETETQTAEKKKSKQRQTQTDEEKQTQTDTFRPKDFKQVQTDTMPKIADDRKKKQDKDRMDVLNWPGERAANESQRPANAYSNDQATGDSDMDMFEAPALMMPVSAAQTAPPRMPYNDAKPADEEVALIPVKATDTRSQQHAPIVILEPKQKSESKRQKQQPNSQPAGKGKDTANARQAAAAAAAAAVPKVRETVVVLGELEAQLRLPDGRRLVMVGPGEYMPVGPALESDEEDSEIDQPNVEEDQLNDVYEPVTLSENTPQNNQQPLAWQPEKTLRDQVKKVVRDEDGYPIYEDVPAVQLVDINYEKPRQQQRGTVQDGKRGDKAPVAAGKQPQQQQPQKNNGNAGKPSPAKWVEPEKVDYEVDQGENNEDEELPDLALDEEGNAQESSGFLNPYWANPLNATNDKEGEGDDVDGVDEFIVPNQQARILNEAPRESSRDSRQDPRQANKPPLPAKGSEKDKKSPAQGVRANASKKGDDKADPPYAKPKKPLAEKVESEEAVYEELPQDMAKEINDDDMMSAPPPLPEKRGSLASNASNKSPKNDNKPSGKTGEGSKLPDGNKANKDKAKDKAKNSDSGKPQNEGDYLALVNDSNNKNQGNKPSANKNQQGVNKKPEQQQPVSSSKNAPDDKNNKEKNKKKQPDDDEVEYMIPIHTADIQELNKPGDGRYVDIPDGDNVDDDLLYMGEVDEPEYANGRLPENAGYDDGEDDYLVPNDSVLLQDEPDYEAGYPVGFDERDESQSGNKAKRSPGEVPVDVLADEGDDSGRFHPVDFLETDDWDDVPITVNPKKKAFSNNAEPKVKQAVTVTEYDIARMFADAPAGSIHQTYNVEHEEEEIMGPLADGAVMVEDGEGSENLLNLDTVSESVELDMKNGWVMMTVRVRSERIVPIRGIDDMFRKSAVIMTRVIAIDLRVSEERRMFYESIVAMSSQEAGSGGRQRRLDAQETFRLYKAFMGIVEADDGAATSERTRIDKRVEEVVHPDLFASDETPTSSTTSLRTAP